MALKGDKELQDFILQLGDNSLILGHRLSEWCGHGPALEQDIALTNISLDHVGQARMYYQLAATMEDGKTEDDYAYLRNEEEYKNLLLLEHENVDFAYTIARSFYYDLFHLSLLQQLTSIDHKGLSEIASQAVKEVRYHVRYSSDWIRRLGDGTEISHEKMQKAIDDLYMYTGEMFMLSEADEFVKSKYKVDPAALRETWSHSIKDVLEESTLVMPEASWFQSGGKTGVHTEKMGFILTELQYMQRAYPDMKW